MTIRGLTCTLYCRTDHYNTSIDLIEPFRCTSISYWNELFMLFPTSLSHCHPINIGHNPYVGVVTCVASRQQDLAVASQRTIEKAQNAKQQWRRTYIHSSLPRNRKSVFCPNMKKPGSNFEEVQFRAVDCLPMTLGGLKERCKESKTIGNTKATKAVKFDGFWIVILKAFSEGKQVEFIGWIPVVW